MKRSTKIQVSVLKKKSSSEIVKLFTSEFIKSIKPLSPTVFNEGNVPLEFIIQSNTKVFTLGKLELSHKVANGTESYPLITIKNCQQYLEKKIRLQAYIKTNFDIVKNQQTNVNYCCGSLVDKSYWKIEAKITQFKLPFINKFCKGQHVEIIGLINNSHHYATVHIQYIDDIVKIDDDTMSFSELMKANKEIIEPDDNDSNKKFKFLLI
ncbi:hypothetical protein KQX54_012513 [Cotesia glomerata]|uniref:Uncharacterized protein n=1 Tax=Cotesia glomerata TaxID=32391 RepID=A0AAV7I329_COTGL|nr:hypothetical protein KQX54_012513 [Cotesia glomerata]